MLSSPNHKRIIVGLLGLILLFSLFTPVLVFADDAGTGEMPGAGTAEEADAGTAGVGKVQLENPLPTSDVPKLVNNIITALLGLTGVLAFVAFIYGGVLWMVSFGDAAKVEKGRKMIIWAVIGLVIVFGSYGIMNLVFRALGFT